MGLVRYRLGELIELTLEVNSKGIYTSADVRGMTITKEIIPTKANVSSVDLSKFLVIHPGDFVFNPRTHGKHIGFGYNDTDESFIISWNNIGFRVKPEMKNIVLAEYLFMHFNRNEWDREACFRSWGSSTEIFSWETLCEMTIDLPPVEIQRKYARVYLAVKENQRVLERGQDDLKLVCDMILDRLKKTAPQKRIGDILEEVDNRNTEGTITESHGININKEFMLSLASSDDLRRYKIVFKNQFAYSSMQTGRDKCIRIALLKDDTPIIVSPAYSVLRKKADDVSEEYLQMWFSRAETDRRGWFMSDASIRSNLDLSRLFELSIPIPDISIQRSIANIYTVYQKRKAIAERLKSLTKTLCPILIKGAIDDAQKSISHQEEN